MHLISIYFFRDACIFLKEVEHNEMYMFSCRTYELETNANDEIEKRIELSQMSTIEL